MKLPSEELQAMEHLIARHLAEANESEETVLLHIHDRLIKIREKCKNQDAKKAKLLSLIQSQNVQ